jgi:hypothetical protein
MWDRNHVVIAVTQQHFDRPMERNSSHCMTAMAIAAAIPDAGHICVDLQTIRWTRRGLRYVCLTPRVCQDRIIQFDQGEREKIVPFTRRMRPAQLIKSGKKRTDTPSNSELRGTGLTVNKEQPHIDGGEVDQAAQGRITEAGERNTDPDRVDGLFVPPPPPQRKRVPRAKVSTAAKGHPHNAGRQVAAGRHLVAPRIWPADAEEMNFGSVKVLWGWIPGLRPVVKFKNRPTGARCGFWAEIRLL